MIKNTTAIMHTMPQRASLQLKKKKSHLDSTTIAVVSNTLEELLKEKENNLVAKKLKLNRWQITLLLHLFFG